jgi:serine/threonine-protein kinase
VVPVQGLRRGADAPDTAEIAPVGSNSRMKLLMGVGLAAVLLGVGAGVVASKSDSGPAGPEVPGTAASKDPVAATGSEPQSLPTPPVPEPKVEPPVQPETPPTPQAVATVPDPVPEKTEPNSAPQNATSHVKPRSAPSGSGSLQLVSECWADVYIDGRRRGRAPMPPLPLPAGTHTLGLLGNLKVAKHRATIVIKPGETLEYIAPCQPAG